MHAGLLVCTGCAAQPHAIQIIISSVVDFKLADPFGGNARAIQQSLYLGKNVGRGLQYHNNVKTHFSRSYDDDTWLNSVCSVRPRRHSVKTINT